MINAIGTYVGSFKRTFDGDSVQDLSNTVQFLENMPNGAIWPDSMGDYTAPSDHQWEGGAYLFDGIDDYIDTGVPTPSYTGKVTFWLKSAAGTIATNRHSSDDYFEIIGGALSSALVSVTIKTGPNNYTLSTTAVTDLNWHFISIEYTGSELYIYVDGVLDASLTGMSTLLPNANNLLFGQRGNTSHYFGGSLFGFNWYDLSGTLLLSYNMDETAGITAYDSSGNGNHGTIINATLSTFHSTQNTYSFANEVGYTAGNGSNGAAVGVNIPRSEAIPTQDILDNPLQYTGRVKYNADLVESHCGTFDGVGDYVDTGINQSATFTIADGSTYSARIKFLGNISDGYQPVFSTQDGKFFVGKQTSNSNIGVEHTGYENSVAVGTNVWDGQEHTLTYVQTNTQRKVYVDGFLAGTVTTSSANRNSIIDFGREAISPVANFKGIIWDVRIFNRSLSDYEVLKIHNGDLISSGLVAAYPVAEGLGSTIYDTSGNGNHGEAKNITGASFWANTQDEFHYNLTKGFTLSGSTKIPALTDGSADALGNVISNPAGAWHNDAETKLFQPQAPALIQADSIDNFWFDSSGVAQAKPYDDLADDVGDNHYSMADVATTNQKKNLVLFDPALADPDLSDVQEYLNH